jgi:20S proteasome subunit beta 2
MDVTLGPPASVVREVDSCSRPRGGFSFSNVARNARLGGSVPRAKLTGTTICGCVFKGGVVLGADTRATGGSEVADKNCDKIHYLAPNIYCCGAGTAADTEKTTELISGQLDLLRLNTGAPSRVVTACTMLKRMLFRYQGHVSAALVLGGVDITGAHLYNIYPHGSSDKLPYLTMGSGSLAAMSVMETRFKEDMSEEEAVALIRDCILAGIYNDLGSGSNCDITIIREGGSVQRHRGYVKGTQVEELRSGVRRPPAVHVPSGATKVLSSTFEPFEGESAPQAAMVL